MMFGHVSLVTQSDQIRGGAVGRYETGTLVDEVTVECAQGQHLGMPVVQDDTVGQRDF